MRELRLEEVTPSPSTAGASVPRADSSGSLRTLLRVRRTRVPTFVITMLTLWLIHLRLRTLCVIIILLLYLKVYTPKPLVAYQVSQVR